MNYILKENAMTKDYKIDGLQKIKDLLESVDTSFKEKILSSLKLKNEKLANAIENSLITVEKLSKLHPTHLEILNANLGDDLLSKILTREEKNIQSVFLKAMSQKRKAVVEDLMSTESPMPKEKLEEYRKKIILIAKKLEQENKIIFPFKDDIV